MDMTEILNTLQTTVIIPLIVVLGSFIVMLVKQGLSYLSDRSKDNRLKKYIGLAGESIEKAVIRTNQTFVDKLKKAGTFSEESYAEAFKQTKEVAISLMTDEAKNLIGEVYNDFDTWLETQIYAQVRINKLGVLECTTSQTAPSGSTVTVTTNVAETDEVK